MGSRLALAIMTVVVHGGVLGARIADARAPQPLVRTAERLRNLAVGEVSATSPEEIAARELEAVLRDELHDTTTAMFVADAATGDQLFAVRPDAHLNPASNVKLIATATALDLLGAQHRYRTFVLGEPPDDEGVIAGDLYLLGTYDPTLDTAGLDDLARQLVEIGVTRFDGDVVIGDPVKRDGIFRSLVDLQVRAAAPGQPPIVTARPATDLVEIVVEATTSKTRRAARPLRISSELHDDGAGHARVRIVVSGQIGRKRTTARRVWVRERALHAAHVLRAALRSRGVVVGGDVRVASVNDHYAASVARGAVPVPLAEHASVPLKKIVQRVNKQSTNWLADRIVMTAAARRYGGAPSMDTAVTAMYAWLERRAGLDRDELVIDSGSGLSYRTAISARQLVTILRTAAGIGDADPVHAARRGRRWQAYRESLAIGGKDGTLRHRFGDLDAVVRGKTGTLSDVVALSGLLEVGPDRHAVFSIITNGHAPQRKAAVRRAQERLVGVLSDYLHH